MILRIFDKQTKLFIRDDSEFNEETEIGIDVEIPQPPIKVISGITPIWDGEKWVQNVEPPEPEPETEPQEPSLEERIQALEVMELERILGGGF